jgi:hypothetical protein
MATSSSSLRELPSKTRLQCRYNLRKHRNGSHWNLETTTKKTANNACLWKREGRATTAWKQPQKTDSEQRVLVEAREARNDGDDGERHNDNNKNHLQLVEARGAARSGGTHLEDKSTTTPFPLQRPLTLLLGLLPVLTTYRSDIPWRKRDLPVAR